MPSETTPTKKAPILKYLLLPEMRTLWFSLVALLVLMVIGLINLPLVWNLISFLIVCGLGVLLFWDKFNSAKSSATREFVFGRLHSIINNLQDGVIVYDNNFRIIVFNPAAEKIFGLNAEEIIGQMFGPDKASEKRYRLVAQTMFPSLAPMVKKKTEPGIYPQIMEISFVDPNLDIRVITAPILANSESVGFVKIVTDRTKEIEIYKSRSEFVSTAAHQLRNPLTTINWAFETLTKGGALPAESKDVVRQGLEVSQTMLKTVNDLMDVAKIEEGKFGYSFESVDLVSFIAEALENVRSYIKNLGIKVSIDFQHTEPSMVLSVDPGRLGLALSNMLDNAVRYNNQNGSITVSLARSEGKPYAEVRVEDTGMGISPEDLDKVSTKFFRAGNAQSAQPNGSGLGLYIAKNIIKRHGGSFTVKSALGRGTSVQFTLPIDARFIPTKEIVYEE